MNMLAAISEWFRLQFASNDFFNGALIAGALGYILVQARSLPVHLWNLFIAQFTVHIIVQEQDSAYINLDLWLGRLPGRKKARRITTAGSSGVGVRTIHVPGSRGGVFFDEDGDPYEVDLTYGPGVHLIWWSRTPILLVKALREGRGNDAKPGKIEMRVLGRSQATIQQIMAEAAKVHIRDDLIPVHNYTGTRYNMIERRVKRPLDSVVIDHATKDALVHDLEYFLENRKWYAERGVPYRRGYFLEGPPGTGKSSLIYALACRFDKPIYVINPSALRDDNALLDALGEGADGFVVIEDIDTLKIATERKPQELPKGMTRQQAEMLHEEGLMSLAGEGVTLSGLLNAIDGVAAKEGRVLFITSNHPDKLDRALIRPGRIDRRFSIDEIDETLAFEMVRRFYPDGSMDHLLKAVEYPVAPARLQGLLLEAEEKRLREAG